MKIGIVSDTHSRYATVAKTLELLHDRKVELVLHCGDIEDGQAVELFQELPTHFVFGNCDTDQREIRRAVEKIGAELHEPFGHLELAGRKLAWIHSDDRKLFKGIELSGEFDYLFYGHSHHAEQHRTGPTQVVNPGALHRAAVKTFVVLDLNSGEMESVTVE